MSPPRRSQRRWAPRPPSAPHKTEETALARTTRPDRPNTPTRPKRAAPRYPTVKPDIYTALDLGEQRRVDLHRHIDDLCDVEPRARLDLDAVGFPGDYRAKDGPRSTDEGALNAVEQAAVHPDPSIGWLAEFAETVAAIKRVCRLGLYGWPPAPAFGTVVLEAGEEITVGERGNQVAVCAWCGDPAPSGRHETTGATLVKRSGGVPLHNPNCYMAAYRDAARRGVTIVAVLAEKTSERKAS